MRTDGGEHSEWFDVTHGLRQGCVLSPLLSNVFFAAALHAVLVHVGKDEVVVREVVLLNDAGGVVGREEQEPLVCVRRAVWGVLYAEDAGNVLKSAEGLTKMMTVIVTLFEAADLSASESKTETALLPTTTDRPNKPRPTARHRSSRPEIWTDGPDLIPRWRYARKR